MVDTARPTVWCVLLVGFVVLGARGLQARRAYNNEFLRVLPGQFGSNDSYLKPFGLSSALVGQAFAGIPASEPVIFVRRADSDMFQEFSILSYTNWPRQLFAVGCGDDGLPSYTDFAPHSDPFTVAIVDKAQAPVGPANDVVHQLAPNTWLVRASPGRPWASFCR